MRNFVRDALPSGLAALFLGSAVGVFTAIVDVSPNTLFVIGFVCGYALMAPMTRVFKARFTPKPRTTHDDI